MAEKDNQSNSQNQHPESYFRQEQYDMLLRCSENKDITEWNQWRKEHPDEKILLREAPLENAYLREAHLENANLYGVHLENAYLREAHLEDANLVSAHLEKADLRIAHLENANLNFAHLKKADLRNAHLKNASLGHAFLKNADLWYAHLENSDFERAHLENSDLTGAHLENANLIGAHLEKADFGIAHLKNAALWHANFENANLRGANLEGVIFQDVYLKGTDFSRAIIDGKMLIWDCEVDRNTKCEGVGLDSIRIHPATKQLLEYNIRRMNWEEWYGKHPKMKWLVKPFWLMSDYGMSTERIVFTFFGLALVFANIYYHWARMAPPGIIENLFVDRNGVDVQWWLVPLRTLYFSIVTQTTLGFGDMYARAQSFCGHILLSLQVILGYVLLGALVTRFAVLFTAGGPAGEFTDKEQKSEQRQQI